MGSRTSRNHLMLLFFEPVNASHMDEMGKSHQLGTDFQEFAEVSHRYCFSVQDRFAQRDVEGGRRRRAFGRDQATHREARYSYRLAQTSQALLYKNCKLLSWCG